MAYDEKYRKRVIAYKEEGHTFAEVYEAFKVYPQSYYRWKKELEEQGSFSNNCAKERNRKIDKAKLSELLKEHPDWYLREFAKECGVCEQAIQKRFAKMGVTRKKKRLRTGKKTRRNGQNT